jgi:hypothetical protein
MADNYLVKVLTLLKGVFFSMPLDGTELSPDLFPVYRGLGKECREKKSFFEKSSFGCVIISR